MQVNGSGIDFVTNLHAYPAEHAPALFYIVLPYSILFYSTLLRLIMFYSVCTGTRRYWTGLHGTLACSPFLGETTSGAVCTEQTAYIDRCPPPPLYHPVMRRQMVGIETANLKWTIAREVISCYEAHGVPLGVSHGVARRS